MTSNITTMQMKTGQFDINLVNIMFLCKTAIRGKSDISTDIFSIVVDLHKTSQELPVHV